MPPSPPPNVSIRDCVPDDAETLVNLVRELAVYEKLESSAVATPGQFRTHLFGPDRAAQAIVAEVDGEAVGFALFFKTFSTFRGQPGFYLEDLYVKPERRGLGIGTALLATLARRAVDSGYGRVEWAVLNWNTPSIGFYESIGARPMNEWTVYRLDDAALDALAGTAGGRGA